MPRRYKHTVADDTYVTARSSHTFPDRWEHVCTDNVVRAAPNGEACSYCRKERWRACTPKQESIIVCIVVTSIVIGLVVHIYYTITAPRHW